MAFTLLAFLLQTASFEDREQGISVEVSVGWQLIYAGREGRIALRRQDEPSTYVRIDLREGDGAETSKDNWGPYLEKFSAAMLKKNPKFELQRKATSIKGDVPAVEIWYSMGVGDESVSGFFRVLAKPDRLLFLSAAVAKDKWPAQFQSIEVTLRSAALLPPTKGAGGVWVDGKNGYSIAVPEGHRVKPENDDGGVLSVFAPKGGTNFNMIVRGPHKSYERSQEKLRAEMEPVFLKKYEDFSFLKFEKLDWDGFPALKTVSAFRKGELQFSNMQLDFSTSKHAYVLTWTAQREAFASELSNFEASLKSFKVTK